MRDKFKNGILYFSIISSILIVVLILINLFKYNSILEFPSLEEFNKKIVIYKEQVNTLKDGKCKDHINNFIDKVKSNNYEGKKDIRELYNSDDSILIYYVSVRDACEFTNERLNDEYIPTMYMSAVIPYEYIYRDYIFGYEITLHDTTEEALKVNLFNTTENIKRNNELEIIEKYIELAKEVQNEK